jgi:UDP-N-acetylglucosamine acyltransferase
VTQDVPPFVMVDGVPATARSINVVGMRRGGLGAEARRQAQSAFRILYRSGLATAAATARLKAELGDEPVIARILEFIEGSRRGIVRAAAPGGEAAADPEGLL